MAYLIAQNDQVYFIASNETRRDLSNQSNTTVIDISDDNFNGLRKYTKEVSISGSTATFTDIDSADQQNFEDADHLQMHFDNIIQKIDDYCRSNSNDLATALTTYKNYLEGLDKSSLTYPIKWEQHCDTNSQTFFCIREIP